MSRWKQITERVAPRLERVLELGEELLRELTGARLSAEDFARGRAFRWESSRGPGHLVPIESPSLFELDDLLGVERSVGALVRNTEQFLAGLPCNHVLLYGERGTGKSSAVRGLLARYGGRGLRLIEVAREDLADLPNVIASLRAGSAQRFLVFCDDLSFGPGEHGYRALKAALEGGLAGPPENLRIVATSNRRHLVPESMADNRSAHVDEAGELHLGEALEEKLALSDRFGLVLPFLSFDQPTYLEIVAHYLEQARLGLTLEDVRGDALRFALNRSSRSGRTARQFVDDLAGRIRLAR